MGLCPRIQGWAYEPAGVVFTLDKSLEMRDWNEEIGLKKATMVSCLVWEKEEKVM